MKIPTHQCVSVSGVSSVIYDTFPLLKQVALRDTVLIVTSPAYSYADHPLIKRSAFWRIDICPLTLCYVLNLNCWRGILAQTCILAASASTLLLYFLVLDFGRIVSILAWLWASSRTENLYFASYSTNFVSSYWYSTSVGIWRLSFVYLHCFEKNKTLFTPARKDWPYFLFTEWSLTHNLAKLMGA